MNGSTFSVSTFSVSGIGAFDIAPHPDEPGRFVLGIHGVDVVDLTGTLDELAAVGHEIVALVASERLGVTS